MQKDEFIQRASIAAMQALLAQGVRDIDAERIVSISNKLADKVYEIVPQQVPQAAVATRSRKKITDMSELKFPYTSDAFMSVWEDLVRRPKWRKKDASSLQYSLDKLAKYEEEFAINLMSNAISGDYQGIEFESTPTAYQKWLAERGRGTFFGQRPQMAPNMKPSKIEQNAMAAAEAAKILLANENGLFNGADEQ